MSADEVQGGGPGQARPFQVGLLGHGTVGGAFSELLASRADEIERFNGLRPVICGVLTRSRGDFEQILAEADLIFEAAVAGAVPVVRVLEESLSATPIERIHGIVNGTTNFILTEMASGSSY